ncbi:hypothetical protein GOODEAATRI_027196 [Goodea atripinnis]|uniref:Uncharacterized protein n=1 Tax=Goodea atripinnis TaxID=208336 RepID=A0ABV0NE21_9TELE
MRRELDLIPPAMRHFAGAIANIHHAGDFCASSLSRFCAEGKQVVQRWEQGTMRERKRNGAPLFSSPLLEQSIIFGLCRNCPSGPTMFHIGFRDHRSRCLSQQAVEKQQADSNINLMHHMWRCCAEQQNSSLRLQLQ